MASLLRARHQARLWVDCTQLTSGCFPSTLPFTSRAPGQSISRAVPSVLLAQKVLIFTTVCLSLVQPPQGIQGTKRIKESQHCLTIPSGIHLKEEQQMGKSPALTLGPCH